MPRPNITERAPLTLGRWMRVLLCLALLPGAFVHLSHAPAHAAVRAMQAAELTADAGQCCRGASPGAAQCGAAVNCSICTPLSASFILAHAGTSRFEPGVPLFVASQIIGPHLRPPRLPAHA